MKVWLASGSPRRKDLLERLGFTVHAQGSDVDESIVPNEDPIGYAQRLAMDKARVAPDDAIVLAADTVVHMQGQIFDKPADRAIAAAHLTALSGVWHAVTTGVCIRRGDEAVTFADTTQVRFRTLDPREIDAYVATGEADDKAGAYGIQGLAGVFVAELAGSWTNVMGLPTERIVEPLVGLGATRWA